MLHIPLQQRQGRPQIIPSLILLINVVTLTGMISTMVPYFQLINSKRTASFLEENKQMDFTRDLNNENSHSVFASQ